MLDLTKQESIKHGTVFFPIQYYWNETDSPLYSLPVHWHTDYEIIHVLDGQFNFLWGSETVILNKDDYVVIQDGVLHGDGDEILSGSYESVVFDFNILRSKHYSQDMFLKNVAEHRVILNKVINIDDPFIKQNMDKLFETMRSRDAGYELLTVGEIMCFFGYIQNKKMYSQDEKIITARNLKNSQLQSVFNYIETNFEKHITLETLSEISGVSPKYFCRIFREYTKYTPIDYLNAYRIDRSCSLLMTTDKTLNEIAKECGFSDSSYYIKIFKKYKGMTPYRYKSFDHKEDVNEGLFFNHEKYFQESPYEKDKDVH